MFLLKDSDTCQLNNYLPFVCYFDQQRELGQHLCGLLRCDSMIATCMFGTLKVAVSLAKSFCPLSAFFSGYRWWQVLGDCLPSYFLLVSVRGEL